MKRKYKKTKKTPELSALKILKVNTINQLGEINAQIETSKSRRDSLENRSIKITNGVAVEVGDTVLARLSKVQAGNCNSYSFRAKIIKKINATPDKIIGILKESKQHTKGTDFIPINRRIRGKFFIEGYKQDAWDGDLVEAAIIKRGLKSKLNRVCILKKLRDRNSPNFTSSISIAEHSIPTSFTKEISEEVKEVSKLPVKCSDSDFMQLPFLTIDPEDAKDHDDAIYAADDVDPKNHGGLSIFIAIADVTYYVKQGGEIDKAAYDRGNSTYFVDNVIPMLPETLSNDLCSLGEGKTRRCLVLKVVLNKKGEKLFHHFYRTTIRVFKSLSYEKAQAVYERKYDETPIRSLEKVIDKLWQAHRLIQKGQKSRQPLDLNIPERKIKFSENGETIFFKKLTRLESHSVVEQFMILANVCAAETIESAKYPALYRSHEKPNEEKVEQIKKLSNLLGIEAKQDSYFTPKTLNHLIIEANNTQFREVVNINILKSMQQAYYTPTNAGHFGLDLERYAHFTSPIRRYADIIVHRALIEIHGWAKPNQNQQLVNLHKAAIHVSNTEKRSNFAERETLDRLLARYLEKNLGANFDAYVLTILKNAIIVKLKETGAEGIVPLNSSEKKFLRKTCRRQFTTEDETNCNVKIGMKLTVKLLEASPASGRLVFKLSQFRNKSF